MATSELLPIKVIFPQGDDFSPPPGGGSDPTVFVEVTPAIRGRFVGQVQAVGQVFAASFARFPKVPAVAKVRLRKEASAKSHRPDRLFSDSTCPVIGTTAFGELLVSVTREALAEVETRIKAGEGRKIEAGISALESIEPYVVENTIQAADSDKAGGRKLVACRLFQHPQPEANEAVESAFQEILQENGAHEAKAVRYTDDLTVYSLGEADNRVISALSGFAGAQSLSNVQEYCAVRSAARALGTLTAEAFPNPIPGQRYGVVGLIDSGTDPNNSHLQAWVDDRFESWVPRNQQNNAHGSFVAGLIINSRSMNHNDERFPSTRSRIVDVVALDADGRINEFDLLTVIDESLKKYPHVKVWNLSLSLMDEVCTDWRFSRLGMALDDRSRRHGVLFVIAAGNYTQEPLRGWPPERQIGEHDRISPPADAVRAITVGSFAHLENASSRVRAGNPSPFTRRGPAPAYLLKPEIGHIGGNCDGKQAYAQVGVISLDRNGRLCECIGSSFPTGLVSSIAASVYDELAVDPDFATPAMLKALVLHSAFVRNGPPDPEHVKYTGLGLPPDAPEILGCAQSAATVILQVPVTTNPRFVREPFPLISALEDDGHLKGEVFVTLVHDTPLDSNFYVEYCRSNVTSSLGWLVENPKTGEKTFPRQIEPVAGYLVDSHEIELVKHGYKWSPLKLYYRKFSRTPANRHWRLLIERLDRAEHVSAAAQMVSLLITIRDSSGRIPVYDRVVQMMGRLGWQTQDLRVRSKIRVQA